MHCIYYNFVSHCLRIILYIIMRVRECDCKINQSSIWETFCSCILYLPTIIYNILIQLFSFSSYHSFEVTRVLYAFARYISGIYVKSVLRYRLYYIVWKVYRTWSGCTQLMHASYIDSVKSNIIYWFVRRRR